MKQDAFSRFHPAVNFLYFVLAIGFGVVMIVLVFLPDLLGKKEDNDDSPVPVKDEETV